MQKKKRQLAKPRRNSPWSDEHYITVYELAKAGLSQMKMAAAIGVTVRTFSLWCKRYPIFQMAIDRGQAAVRSEDGTDTTFREYVYQHLDPHLQKVWDRINACAEAGSGASRIEEIFDREGIRVRQHLFIYALTASNFNASYACRKVGIARPTLEHWISADPDFAALFDEVHWHKGNFFEDSLIRLVDKGDPSAVIFANRTFNRDRGYGAEVSVNVSGTVNHQHAHVLIDIDDLDLPLSVRRQILAAYRQKQSVLESKS